MADVVRLSTSPNSDPFSALWELGYKNLIPIIPPGAPLSEKSNIARRLDGGTDARGKAPGVKWPDNTWSGFDWIPCHADERDLLRWSQMGAGVGIKTGDDNLIAIDADTMHEDRAAIIREEIEKTIGKLPVRIGQQPKALYVVRTDKPIPYQRIEFGELNERGTLTERVEILSKGKQFVAYGVHPKTKAPYRWVSKLEPLDKIPVVAAEKITDLLAALARLLPQSTPIKHEGSTAEVDQDTLRGDLEMVRKAVAAMPNTSKLFPTRESYRDIGYAIKASLPDDGDAAFEIFWEWCARWMGGENDLGIVKDDWSRMKPPFRRGASWLFDQSEKLSEGRWTRGELWFEPVEPEYVSLFCEEPHAEVRPALRTFTAASLFGKPIPAQEWLVKDVIPANNVTLLGGDGGTGKSLLSLQLADAVASGGSWLGLETARGPVLFLSAEDEEDELHRRSSRIRPDLEVLEDLVFAPLAGEDAVLMAPSGKDGLLKRTAVFGAFEETVRTVRPRLVVLDTLADLFGGDEIKKIHARQFVAELRGVALEYGVTVLLLYHPSQSGMTSGAGTSGNTAWNNSVRSRLYFTADEDDRDLRHLEVMKSNRSQKGEKFDLRYAGGRFILEGGAQPRLSKSELEESAERVFMKLVDQFAREGRNASHSANAANFAPKTFAAHPLAENIGKPHFIKAMDRLFASGRIQIETYGKKTQPKERIVRVAHVQEVSEEAATNKDDDFFAGLI